MKVIMLTCVHGRADTVKKCFDLMPFVEKVVVYSDVKDKPKREDVILSARTKNTPLSFKWQFGIELLRYMDFDRVIIMGSDDYMDEKTYRFICDKGRGVDVFGFTDCYFRQDDRLFYWKGYTGIHEGQTIGCVRTYSKALLERMDYQLYPLEANSGLDRMATDQLEAYDYSYINVSLKDHGLFMCDVKDGKGITPITTITNRVLCR